MNYIKFEILTPIEKENHWEVGECEILTVSGGLITYRGWGGQTYYTTQIRLNNHYKRGLIKIIE